MTDSDKNFFRGWIAALCVYISLKGEADTYAREMWQAIGLKWSYLRHLKVDEHDRKILSKNKSILLKTN